ncbi:MFS transporter [Phytohabitans sp. ZYX-F-186]|uniref:MFS transporter n=1 Tax=Phytohabitans maris TaxID=3071409 RepID=A0ABU0ZCA3_9ACTN|nr:MFS transporter [Phytohabitans sp. ZYX-F-186]MDQ7904613.1 MFS transporter [Phytohabitans sp. ZYX-F-186]
MARVTRGALLAQVAFVTSAGSSVRPMLTYRAVDLGASGLEIGLLATTFALLPVLFAFAIGRGIDRRGPMRFLLAGSAVSVGGSTLAIAAPRLLVLYAATAALGLGQLLSMLAQQSVVAAAPADERDRAFGRFSSATAVGLMAGPPLATVTADHSEALGLSEAVVGLLVGLILSVVAFVVAWAVRRHPFPGRQLTAAEPTHRLVAQIFRTGGMWQALLAGGTVLAAIDLLAAFLPLWARDRGISIGVVGLLLTVRGAFTLLSRIGSERLLRAVGRRVLLAGSLVAAAAGLLTLTFVGLLGALLVMIVLGAGLGLAQPLTMSWIVAVSAPGTRGAALGLRVTANRVAQATLPAAIAAVSAGSGANGVFWGAALILSTASAALMRAPMGRPGG